MGADHEAGGAGRPLAYLPGRHHRDCLREEPDHLRLVVAFSNHWCFYRSIIGVIHEHGFPANGDAISAAFTRACKMLGIKDLHFHDLRHEGISRLFEMAQTIPQVASVSGHRSWQSLKRYTHMEEVGDKWANWKWLDVVCR